MLTGLPPFFCQDREELFNKIKFQSLKYPEALTPAAKSLLEGLFQKNPEKRLGFLGAKQIKIHPWFNIVNWDALVKKEIKPPFLPIIKSEVDVSNFDTEFTECPIESYTQNSLSLASAHNAYPNFTYDAKKEGQV